MLELPCLYKKTNTGALQFWTISVKETEEGFGEIKTRYGQIDTTSPQETTDVIKKGKNIGKKTETNPYQQACVKAQQMWESKKKDDYLEDRERAEKGETDLPGIEPMLAEKYIDRKDELVFPVMTQPKLDGMRCIAVCKDGKVTLFSRSRKPILTVPHIVKELEEKAARYGDFILDGELYNHDLKEDFNEILSILKRKELHPDHTKAQYHIYDSPSENITSTRMAKLITLFNMMEEPKYLKLVHTEVARSKEEVEEQLNLFLDIGYEGIMIRLDQPYEFKRSKSLLKYKVFMDDEYKIVGVKEGTGKLMGHAGSFICEMADGRTFSAKLEGKLENLKEYFINIDKYIGKKLTVRYFRLTPAGIPRFPVGVTVRDYE